MPLGSSKSFMFLASKLLKMLSPSFSASSIIIDSQVGFCDSISFLFSLFYLRIELLSNYLEETTFFK
jgi:hypothetical protein